MKYLSAKEMAQKWNITTRRVTELCRDGKIEGAVQQGKFWRVPENAKRPADGRRYLFLSDEGRVSEKSSMEKKYPPIGVSDFVRTVSDYYYVDKTLLIKDIL